MFSIHVLDTSIRCNSLLVSKLWIVSRCMKLSRLIDYGRLRSPFLKGTRRDFSFFLWAVHNGCHWAAPRCFFWWTVLAFVHRASFLDTIMLPCSVGWQWVALLSGLVPTFCGDLVCRASCSPSFELPVKVRDVADMKCSTLPKLHRALSCALRIGFI